MVFGKVIIVVPSLLMLYCFRGVSLHDVKLLVEPARVVENGTVALICARDLPDSLLYSVQWYRGNHEFYRYTPKESPPTKVFELKGIYVDMNRSNGTQVLLRKVGMNLAGNFACEVTAEKPPFSTRTDHRNIEIVSPPHRGPVLRAERDRYVPGQILRVNCTAPPARPPANLTFYVNDRPYPSSPTSLHPSELGLAWSNTSLVLPVLSDSFLGGRLRVACVASVYDVYEKTATLDFFTPDTDPRPERITFNSGTRSRFSYLLLSLSILVINDVIKFGDVRRLTTTPIVGG